MIFFNSSRYQAYHVRVSLKSLKSQWWYNTWSLQCCLIAFNMGHFSSSIWICMASTEMRTKNTLRNGIYKVIHTVICNGTSKHSFKLVQPFTWWYWRDWFVSESCQCVCEYFPRKIILNVVEKIYIDQNTTIRLNTYRERFRRSIISIYGSKEQFVNN